MDKRPGLKRDELSEAYGVAVRSMSSATSATKVYYVPNPPSEAKRVYRVSPVKDFFVERNEVEASASRLYEEVKPGQVMRLAAGTGTGKSTRVQLYLAQQFQTIGILVLPNRRYARSVYKYLRYDLGAKSFPKVTVRSLSSSADLVGLNAPALCVCAAADLLNAFVMESTLFEGGEVGYVCLDEAHGKWPTYFVIRLLATNMYFSGTRVFMASATGTGDNLEARMGVVKRNVVKLQPRDANYESPEILTAKSPLHFQSIKSRTMIFVPTASAMPRLTEYYESNGLEVLQLSELSVGEDLEEVQKILKKHKRPCVLLATQHYEECYTFDIDAVVDCGVTRYLGIDISKGTMVNRERKETLSERYQRSGRAARHMDGTAYHIDGEPSPDDYDITPGLEVYVPLWCYALGIEYKAPSLIPWAEALGVLTPRKVAVLLHSVIHPLLLSPFLDENGCCRFETRGIISMTCATAEILDSSDETYSSDMIGWKEFNTGHVSWLSSPAPYKSPFAVPREWVVIMYTLHLKCVDLYSETYEKDFPDDVSVYTSVQDKEEMRITSAFKRTSVGRRDTSYPIKAESVFDEKEFVTPSRRLRETLQRVRSPERVGVTREIVYPAPRRYSGTSGSSHSESFDYPQHAKELPALPNVEINSYKKKSRRDRGTVRESSGSGTSDDAVKVARVRREQIAVSKLHNQRLYPYNDELFDTFVLQSTTVDSVDTARYKELRDRVVDLSKLPLSECEQFFLSTIRVWNAAVIDSMQVGRSFRGGLFDTTRGVRIRAQERRAFCKNFFLAFDFMGLFIAVARSSKQCSHVTDTTDVQSACTIESYSAEKEETARHLLQIGNDRFRDAVSAVGTLLKIHTREGVRKGLYLELGSHTLGVYHTFSDDTGGKMALYSPATVYTRTITDCVLDYVVFGHVKEELKADALVLRDPVPFEEAVVVTRSIHDGSCLTLGPYGVFGDEEDWVYDGTMPGGSSGSVLVAVSDGAVIGLHVGIFGEVEGATVSAFVRAGLFSAAMF